MTETQAESRRNEARVGDVTEDVKLTGTEFVTRVRVTD